MNRAHKSQIKEITIQLTELKVRLNAINWELGENIPIEKSVAIGKVVKILDDAAKRLMEVI